MNVDEGTGSTLALLPAQTKSEGTRIGASLKCLIRVCTAAQLFREGCLGNFAIDRCLELILLQLESAFRIDRPVQG